MAVIEIATIEGGRLGWVGIYSDTDTNRAIRWGDQMMSGFRAGELKPGIRILDKRACDGGKVIGAWQANGYEVEL